MSVLPPPVGLSTFYVFFVKSRAKSRQSKNYQIGFHILSFLTASAEIQLI